MTISKQVCIALAAASLLAACANEEPAVDGSELSAAELASFDDAKADTVAGLPAGSQHLYFDAASSAYVGEDQDGTVREDLAYRWFTALPGHEFKVGAAVLDENNSPLAGVHVGFKLQRAVRSGNHYNFVVVGSKDSNTGAASLRYTPPSSAPKRLYLLTVTSSPLPEQLSITLGCAGGHQYCTTALEPGDSCGGNVRGPARACDSGLFCHYSLEAICGAADAPGACDIIPSICPRGIRYFPVCGCDGKTYDGACNAGRAGVSVARLGDCNDVDVVGSWTYAPSSHYDYTFNADGTFTSVQQPSCAFTTPRCLVKIAPNSGHFSTAGKVVTLSYDMGLRAGQTATLTSTGSGNNQRLNGTDFGITVHLQRN